MVTIATSTCGALDWPTNWLPFNLGTWIQDLGYWGASTGGNPHGCNYIQVSCTHPCDGCHCHKGARTQSEDLGNPLPLVKLEHLVYKGS
jgi:hypothetical protein